MVYCDKEAAVVMQNAGYSQDTHIVHLLRYLFFLKTYHQIELRAVHTEGEGERGVICSHTGMLSVFTIP